jgi:hypothetical protein
VRPLIRKELREHGVVFLLALAVYVAVAGLVFAGATRGSPPKLAVELLGAALLILVITLCPLVGQRLLSREYRGRTQLFLETLPVARWEILLAKLLVGGVYVALAALLVTTLALLEGDRPLLEGAISAALVRTQAFVLTGWAFVALFSLLGRYRVPLLVFTFLVIALLATEHDVDVSRAGPLALVDERLGFEGLLPTADLWISAAFALCCVLTTAALTLTREGSVAARLAERMSQREKVFIAGLVVVAAFGIGMATDDDDDEPYEFAADISEARDGVDVRLRSDDDGDDKMRALAASLADTLVEVNAELGIESLPPFLLTERKDLSAREYDRGWISKGEGVLVRFHPSDEGFEADRFMAWMIRHLVAERAEGRPWLEPNRWLLDGAGHALLARDDVDRFAARPLWLRRALYGTPEGPQEAWLDDWYRYRESVGDDVAHAVAWSALVAAIDLAGWDAVRALLRDTLARDVDDDARAALHEALHPISEKLEEHLGVSRAQLVARWRELLDAQRKTHADALARAPRLRASLRATPDRKDARVAWFLDDDSLPDGAQVRFRFIKLGWMNRPLDPDDIGTVRIDAARAREGRPFPRGWAAGTRLAWAVEYFDAGLGADVTSGWVRETLP